VVDCTIGSGWAFGCGGGWPDMATKYLAEKGVMSAADYPYVSGNTGANGPCKNKTKISFTVQNLEQCRYDDNTCGPNSEKWFALLRQGALIVLIQVDGPFWGYTSGILDYPCLADLNHAVIAVGYGVDKKVGTYIIVRNSWGSGWGEYGYFRIKFNNANNHSCFITAWGWLSN